MDNVSALLVALLAAYGVTAGALTTVTGFGGGLVLTLGIAAVLDPLTALAIAAPALLVGNVHRLWMYRQAIDGEVARTMVAGAVPGVVLGSILLFVVPPSVLPIAMLAACLFAVAERLGLIPLAWGRTAVGPAGGVIGLLVSTTGGGGVLMPPALMAAGLRGRAFVATAAVTATAIHITRLVTYGASGMFGRQLLPHVAVVTVALYLGNLVGKGIATRVSEALQVRLTYGALALGVGLGLWNAVANL